ncbi:perivitellin-2 67 kDa subunit-like [Physella acuta]|uniref:perivitellin-2 67 kDa subunit-like n=1 Tax=Physella acuta TaxID=109671 RepID=UPI0027DADD7E|nr:perivitellin-2 67 kDa subunit-like [Physella acuta]
MFKHFLILFAVVLSLEAARPCSNLLPGLSKITKGADITRLDLLPIDFSGNDGIKNPIFQLTCDQGKTWRSPKGKTYDMPDQIWQIDSVPGGYLSSEVSTYTSYNEVRDSMGANAGLEVNAKKYAFSASFSYKKMQTSITNSSRYLSDVTSFAGQTRVNVNPPQNLALDNYAKTYIDTTLTGTYDSNPNVYNKFIETYGTHYFSTASFGGYVRMLFEITKEYFSTKSEVDIEANAKASYMQMVSVSGGGSSSNVKIDETFKSNSKQTIKYYGGDTNLLNKADGFSQWQPTVENDPWLYSSVLKPISDLITDTTKKASMEKAVKNYMIRSYLGELESIINGARAKLDNTITTAFLSRLQDLKNSKEVSESAVDALSRDVEEYVNIPPWFLTNTKLCMHWWGTNDATQCYGGGYTPEYLCAKVNQMTELYHDWTDWRIGGCKMRWAIFSSVNNAPEWMNQVQMCYQWYADGDANQCGGDAGKTYCAPINQYTTEYFDDTGNRNGGCQMRWMIKVPNNAPLWAKGVHMCYNWAAEGFAGQCGGAPLNQCVIANTWTQYYRDHTDDTWGGCTMSWGLKTSV